jgi:isocitrate dehydrogenase
VEENAALIEPGLEFGNQQFRDELYAEIKGVLDSIGKTHGNGAWKTKILVNDRIADSIFQQIIIRPSDYSSSPRPTSMATTSRTPRRRRSAGSGIAPGANIGDGYAVFEATHGTAPKYADKDVINPGSVILSGVMLLDFIGWKEAAKLIETAMEKTTIRHAEDGWGHQVGPASTRII